MRHSFSPLVLILMAVGCALNRTADHLGHSFVAGARAELHDSSTRQAIHLFLDSTIADAHGSVDASLHAVAGFKDSVLVATRESLATALEGRMSTALASLVRSNIRVAGDEGRAQMVALSRVLASGLDTSVRTATRAFMQELSAGLRNELKVAAESALAAVVRTGVQSGDREVQHTGVGKTLVWIGVGLVAAIIALAIAWVVRDRQRNRTALDVVLAEVARRGDPQLDRAIKSRATQQRVERYVVRRTQPATS